MVKEIPKITTVAALYARFWLIFHALYVHPLPTDQAEMREIMTALFGLFFLLEVITLNLHFAAHEIKTVNMGS